MVDDFQPFFVKFGAVYVVNTSNSRVYGPLASRVARGDLSPYPQNVGATISNIVTADFAAGVFVNPNWSFNIASGIPAYVNIKTKGFNPLNPPLLNGTKLGEGLLSLVPMTVVYHFNQFGPFQPYIGVGLTPVFSFGNKNAFLTGITVPSTIGGVLQAGADYMFDRHWGVSFDVKKYLRLRRTDRQRRLAAAGCFGLQHAAHQLSAVDVRLGPRLSFRRARRRARGRQILSLSAASGLRVSNPRLWRGFSFALRRSILAG